ncbi:hypothetical protein [Dactylosporangium cerinum]
MSLAVAVRTVARELGEHWALSPGDAAAAAHDAVHLFDESGIFVMSGADAVIEPRLALFAEIGDALRMVDRPDEVSAWVEARVQGGQAEPLVLAAALSSDAASAVIAAVRRSPADRELVHAAVRAHAEGRVWMTGPCTPCARR